jgi:hypothetical protein
MWVFCRIRDGQDLHARFFQLRQGLDSTSTHPSSQDMDPWLTLGPSTCPRLQVSLGCPGSHLLGCIHATSLRVHKPSLSGRGHLIHPSARFFLIPGHDDFGVVHRRRHPSPHHGSPFPSSTPCSLRSRWDPFPGSDDFLLSLAFFFLHLTLSWFGPLPVPFPVLSDFSSALLVQATCRHPVCRGSLPSYG